MASSAWKIKVGVELDTSDIQSQLNRQDWNIDLGGSSRGIRDLTAAGNQMNLTYQAAHEIFSKSVGAISNMVSQVKEMDSAITEFRKISELSGSSLNSYIEELADAGKVTGRTASAMLEAATMFRKSGFNDQESKNLATMATMYQNISDVQVSASDAAATIVSQLQAYGRETLEPIHILDAYNKVAADFAIGTNDISKAMEVAAAGMSTYGNSFEETIGLITAGTEIMQGRSSQVARGLNTIAAHVVSSKDKLLEYGIQVEDTNGNLKSTYEVLKELKPIWDKLSDSKRVALGKELAGGVNQYKVLASIMKNFDHAVGATTSALNSNGVALAQNAAYMESIEAKATAVSAAFQQMSLKVVDSNLVKGILDIAKAFAEFGSTDFGAGITQILLLSGASWGGLQLLGNSILPGIIGAFRTFNAVLEAGSIATVASAAGTSTLAVGLSVALPVILGVTAAIVGLIAVVKGIKSAYEEANPSVEQAYANMQEANEELASTENKYTEAKNKLEELNSTPFEDRTAEMQAEIDKLQSLVEYYEAVKEAREGKVDEATASYIKSVESEGFKQGINVSGVVKTGGVTKEGLAEVKEFTGNYKDLESAVIAAASAEAKFNGNIIDISDIQKASVELQRYGYIFEDNIISTFQLQTSLNDFRMGLVETKKLTPSLISQYEKLISTGKEYAEKLQEQKEKGVELTFQQRNFLTTWDLVNATYNAYKNNIEEVTDSTISQVYATEQAASALSTFAQNLLAASAAYQLFKDQMEATGDYDDSFKGLVSVFNELNGEYEKGQVGSTAFLTALELLTGQSFTSAEAVDYMNTHLDTLQLLFGDSESGGMGLITALQDLGYATLDADGNLQVSIDDFSSLASKLGISEGALYSLTQALKVMGINFEYSAEDILDNVSKLGDGIVENLGDKTIVNFEKFVEKAQEAGMSTNEISQIGDVLSNASNVNLTNVNEGLTLLESSSGEASGSADDLTGSLEDIGGTSGGIDSTASSVSTLSDNLASASGSASSLYTSLSGISNLKFPSLFNLIGFNAEGTNYAEEGDSLVNEEGPELIQSRDKAYIAGGGLPTITHLHRGDKVYTAEETKDILKGEELSNPIQAHEKGTLKNGGSSKKITINGGTTSIAASLLAGLKGQSRGTTRGSSSSSSSSTSSSSLPQSSSQDSSKDEFDEWLKAKKHALAMDEITEEQYYTELEKMNEKYFKNSKEYQDEYWKYQEEVYKWRKSQLDDENKLLEKQIDLEKALSELAKAKEQKILVYKDGRFQYIQDIDAIDEAQRNVAKLKSEAGYASGTTNASAGIHLVGENGPELRVLNSGDGIIPADATKNLLSLAQMNGVKLGDGLNKAMQILYSFDISNLSLPNVRNATEFFEGLKNYAYQYSYAQ